MDPAYNLSKEVKDDVCAEHNIYHSDYTCNYIV